MPRVIFFEEDELLSNEWMLETEIALEQYDDDDYIRTESPKQGIRMILENSNLVVAVVGHCRDLDDPEYTIGNLLSDIKNSFRGFIIKVSDLEEHQRKVFLQFGATHTSTRSDVPSVLKQLLLS